MVQLTTLSLPTRVEVELGCDKKMNLIAATKRQHVEDYKGEYAQQLVKTNQNEF